MMDPDSVAEGERMYGRGDDFTVLPKKA